MHISLFIKIFFTCVAMFLVAACGDSGTPAVTYESQSTATYKVEYIPGLTTTEGKSSFKIKVSNKATGAAVIGKTIDLLPSMDMGTMKHSTPVDSFKDNGDGTYSCGIYYLMASTMSDGSSMGTWELKFTIDGETAIFNPKVAMAMGTPAKVTLKGLTDTIGSMAGSATKRSYYLFNDGISGKDFKLFIAAGNDSMMTQYPAVSTGTALAGLTVNAIAVEVSTDKTTWLPLSDNGKGHWSTALATSPATGTHLYVRLTINGEQKTTDGNAVTATNAYGDFTIAGM